MCLQGIPKRRHNLLLSQGIDLSMSAKLAAHDNGYRSCSKVATELVRWESVGNALSSSEHNLVVVGS
jgi:hypothetical protein